MAEENSNWQLRAKGDFTTISQGSPSSFWSSGLQRRLNLALKYITFSKKRVLDMGCGTGMFMKQFRDLGADVHGFDIDAKKVEIAQKEFPNAKVAQSEDLPYKDESFDIVWSHEVIEHVHNDRKTVEEALRVLAPGGYLVIFCPNRGWPFETHGIYVNGTYYFGNKFLVPWMPKRIYKNLTPHVRNYTNSDLRKLFSGLDVKILKHTHVFPGFDQLAQKSKVFAFLIKMMIYPLEHTPLHNFGLSHFLVAQKNNRNG